MKYFVPKLEAAEDFDGRTVLKEKLGGLPFGLPPEMYPVCRECGNPMSLLAQFVHHDERLDLGKAGRALFVFQCDKMRADFSTCPTWEPDSGANTCFIVEPENLTDRVEQEPGGNIELEKEYWVTNWLEFDDGISEEDSLAFFDEDKYYELDDETFEQLSEKIDERTKLGGVPSWIQSPEIPEGKWKFVGKLDSNTGFDFGDAGTGFIFVERIGNPLTLPKGKFLWQCT